MPDADPNNPEQVPQTGVTPESNQPAQPLPHLSTSRDSMSDKLGELQVERVEASDELERIRNQSASQLQNQVQVEDEPVARDAFADDGSGVMDLLREANLSPKHLRFCCGGIVLLVLLIALGFGGMRFVQWWGDRPADETQTSIITDLPEPVLEEPIDDGSTFTEIDEELKYIDGTVYSALLLGEYEPQEDPAVDAGELLGEELVSSDSLATSITLFAELFEALQVDVQALLDQSTDRRDTLDDYTNQLRYLSSRGQTELEDLRSYANNLASQFQKTEDEKNLFEERFFEDLANLDAYGATSNLNEFVVRGEEVVAIRAQYLARLKLIEYYELVLDAMERRITDIELNEEAIVKGIQVVEIQGSNIDLIIQEDEL